MGTSPAERASRDKKCENKPIKDLFFRTERDIIMVSMQKKEHVMDIEHFIHPSRDEQPLETLNPPGGMAAIFRRIACVGDSLSSGELETWDPNGN